MRPDLMSIDSSVTPLSPLPAWPAARAAINRSASGPVARRYASAMFFTVWSDTMMFACAAKPRPTITCPFPAATMSPPGVSVRPPAQSKHESPVQLAALPCASTMPTCRCARRVSPRITMRSASGALAPRAISPSPCAPDAVLPTARCLQVAPRALGAALRGGERSVALGGLELRLHVAELALGERLLVALRLELALQYRDALPVLAGETVGDLHRLLVLNLPSQPATALGIGEALALGRELHFGPLQRFGQLAHGHLRLHHRFAHLAGEVLQVVRRRRRVERGPERGPETLEHGAISSSGSSSRRTPRAAAPRRATGTWGIRGAGARAR